MGNHACQQITMFKKYRKEFSSWEALLVLGDPLGSLAPNKVLRESSGSLGRPRASNQGSWIKGKDEMVYTNKLKAYVHVFHHQDYYKAHFVLK